MDTIRQETAKQPEFDQTPAGPMEKLVLTDSALGRLRRRVSDYQAVETKVWLFVLHRWWRGVMAQRWLCVSVTNQEKGIVRGLK